MSEREAKAVRIDWAKVDGTIASERSSTIVFPFPVDLGRLLGAATPERKAAE
jgi:hypothetical protein